MNEVLSFENLLNQISEQTAVFIQDTLKMIDSDWWNKLVIKNLSSYGRRKVEINGNKSLLEVDIHLLLKILDVNWQEISTTKNISETNKYYTDEIPGVYSRLSNYSNEIESREDDVYRDLDLLYRFCKIIGANEELIQNIQDAKILIKDNNIQEITAQSIIVNHYDIGEMVCLRSNNDIQGAVIEIMEGEDEYRYKVFTVNGIQTYYHSQLQKIKTDKQTKEIEYDEFIALLTAMQINTPNLSTLYSLNSAKIDYIPHQFRPVLKFIRSERPRLLIADGVGVGKTIEAGLVLQELKARKDVNSVLIICPRPLVTERKWELEMKRFDESFTHLNGELLRQCIKETDYDGEWPEKYSKIIIPYSLFNESTVSGINNRLHNRNLGLISLNPPPKFDLVIVDEAHHIRNTNTYSYKAVQYFCNNAEAALFLTATPIQLGDEDLFVLLNLLRPDLILDKESFTSMSEPNPHINKAVTYIRSKCDNWATLAKEELIMASATTWGRIVYTSNPDFLNSIECLSNEEISNDDRIRLINQIEGLHSFSSVINRTRRRDIGNYTVRKPETVRIKFTKEQRILHDRFLQIQAEILTRIHSDINIKFLMSTIRRQIASCIFGLVPFLEEILTRHLDELMLDYNMDVEIDNIDINSIRQQIDEVIVLAENLPPEDPKLEGLITIINEKQTQDNNKIMIFSTFRHTLYYLWEKLSKQNYRIGLIHGGVDDDERIRLRRRFELPKELPDAIDIMLFSEVGCEGLDYQFCDCMVNYDLPWNPMRIEQRIGRIDRNGQKSEYVSIFNMITPGTVDADIYERCLLRIGVFEESIGGSEEILGKITKEIQNIAENFSLTDEERNKKLQQLADNEIRIIKEQEILEERQADLFSIEIPKMQMYQDIENASSLWLSKESLINLLKVYLKNRLKSNKEYILGEKDEKTLRLSLDARNLLLEDFRKLTRMKSDVYREWEKWLKADNPHLSITLNPEIANNDKSIMLITPIHPLIRQASLYINKFEKARTTIKVRDKDIQAGEYPFAIYQWKFYGAKEDVVLKPLSDCSEIEDNIFELIKDGENCKKQIKIEESSWDVIDNKHYKLWSSELFKHKDYTNELINYKIASLNTSHCSRMALLNEQLSNASDDRIILMKKSEINSAQADYARRIQELEMASERADIVSEVVAYGIIIVED